MRKWTLLACLLLVVLFASTANAYWQQVWVQQTYQVLVYPPAEYRLCSEGYYHWVQPAPYYAWRTYYVPQCVWVPEPIYYSTLPVYVYP